MQQGQPRNNPFFFLCVEVPHHIYEASIPKITIFSSTMKYDNLGQKK
jgi:hypothetical protein